MIIKEKNSDGDIEEKTITDQKMIEWKVRKFYWSRYRKQEVNIDQNQIMEIAGHIKKISEVEKTELEKR